MQSFFFLNVDVGPDACSRIAASYCSLGWIVARSAFTAAHVCAKTDSATGGRSEEGPKQQYSTKVSCHRRLEDR